MMGDMLGNQISAGVGSVPDFIENHAAGKLRVVAVLGGARQNASEVGHYRGARPRTAGRCPYLRRSSPAGARPAASDRSVLAALEGDPHRYSKRLTRWGLTVQFMPQAQLAARERAYSQTWAQIIRKRVSAAVKRPGLGHSVAANALLITTLDLDELC